MHYYPSILALQDWSALERVLERWGFPTAVLVVLSAMLYFGVRRGIWPYLKERLDAAKVAQEKVEIIYAEQLEDVKVQKQKVENAKERIEQLHVTTLESFKDLLEESNRQARRQTEMLTEVLAEVRAQRR